MLKAVSWNQIKQRVGYFIRLNQMSVEMMLTNPVDEKNRSVVFFGDSRAKSWATPPDLHSLTFRNRGISLDTSSQSLNRFDKHVRPIQPQCVVLQVGVNDFKPISYSPNQKEKVFAAFKQNIRELHARSLAIGATLILTTIFPVGWQKPAGFGSFWQPEVAGAIADMNAYIRSLGTSDCWVLDAFFILANEVGCIQDSYAVDSLHINSLGYTALNKALTAVFANMNLVPDASDLSADISRHYV